MSLKSNMQMLNLGLSIFNKLQTIQHRQIRMNNPAGSRRSRNHRNFVPMTRDQTITDAELLDSFNKAPDNI